MQVKLKSDSHFPQILNGFALVIMIGYLLYKGFTTIVFLPFAAGGSFGAYIYPVFVICLALACTVLSILRYQLAASCVAAVITIAAFSYWGFVISHGTKPIWSDFRWFVIPEICFAAATFGRSAFNQNHKATKSVSALYGD